MEYSLIQWTHHTFNPWIGCTKVSPGCLNCYAEFITPVRVHRKNGRECWGKGKPRIRTSENYWNQPRLWNKKLWQCQACQQLFTDRHTTCQNKKCLSQLPLVKIRPRVFPSACDWLDNEVDINWLADFLKVIQDTPNLDWLLLTKRPENFIPRLRQVSFLDEGALPRRPECLMAAHWLNHKCDMPIPENVWLGVSTENQHEADRRIPILLNTPAHIRFLSAEPLLEQVDLTWHINRPDVNPRWPSQIDWVITGGESGDKPRPCATNWIDKIVTDTKKAGVACYVKQLGANAITENWPKTARDFTNFGRVTNLSFEHPKGGDMNEWPMALRVRQFPKVAA